MSMKFVIVESAAKAATLSRILGSGYAVETVSGPVRDFPQDYIGAGEGVRAPREAFEVSEKRRADVTALCAKAARCDTVLLAQEPTWEGESAAWNLREALSGAGCAAPMRRVRLASLAPDAVRRAFDKPVDIDMRLVDAHIVRRIFDRIVAFRIGPFVWKNVRRGLPASRFQVALLEGIRRQSPAAGGDEGPAPWAVGALARIRGVANPVPLRLVSINSEPAEPGPEAAATEIRAALDRCTLLVSSHTTTEITNPSPPPFTTATLLQAASDMFGLSPARTLAIAQRLYEGVEIGSGPMGLITFPVSSLSAVPRDDARAVRAYIRKRFGPRFVAGGTFSTVDRDAVCAIRPVNVSVEPESLQSALDPISFRLYALIWRRFVASQMAPEKVDETTLLVNAAGAPKAYRFSATTNTVTFHGHRIVSDTITPHPVPSDEPLPEQAPGTELELVEWTCAEQRPPEPPACTESSLVVTLSRGIAAHIPPVLASLAALRFHKCLEAPRPGDVVVATDLGARLREFLMDSFPAVFSADATEDAVKSLDDVAEGSTEWAEPITMLDTVVRDAVSEALAPPRADVDKVEAVLQALDSIVNWEPSGNEEPFYHAMRDLFADENGSGVSVRNFERLLKILGHYRAQIPGFVDLVRRIGRFDLLELPDNAPDIKTIRAKMEWVDKAPLSPESKRFVESLKHQADSGRHLTGAQVRVLDDILAAQALRIPGLTPEILKEFGITPRSEADIEKIQRLLDTLSSIKEWRPPSQRGKRTYDDQAFTASVRDQFKRRGDLSPAQLNAVKRMVARYHAQIPNYKEIAEIYELPPEGLAPPVPGRRRKRPLPTPAAGDASAATAPTPAAVPPPAERNPVEDL